MMASGMARSQHPPGVVGVDALLLQLPGEDQRTDQAGDGHDEAVPVDGKAAELEQDRVDRDVDVGEGCPSVIAVEWVLAHSEAELQDLTLPRRSGRAVRYEPDAAWSHGLTPSLVLPKSVPSVGRSLAVPLSRADSRPAPLRVAHDRTRLVTAYPHVSGSTSCGREAGEHRLTRGEREP